LGRQNEGGKLEGERGDIGGGEFGIYLFPKIFIKEMMRRGSPEEERHRRGGLSRKFRD